MRPKLGHRLERAAPFVRAQQAAQPLRWPDRAAGLLELETGAVDGKLQLPDAPPPLRPPPQRDARAREGAIGRVVVDRGEDAGLEGLAAEVGELEPLRCLQLALVLHGGLHGCRR